jgi:hypothetical protein
MEPSGSIHPSPDLDPVQSDSLNLHGLLRGANAAGTGKNHGEDGAGWPAVLSETLCIRVHKPLPLEEGMGQHRDLERFGISCPVLVAAGSGARNGAPCSFLITAIPDAVPLDDYLRQLYDAPGMQWFGKPEQLIRKIAELARGFTTMAFYKDFYLCRVRHHETPVALTDRFTLGARPLVWPPLGGQDTPP